MIESNNLKSSISLTLSNFDKYGNSDFFILENLDQLNQIINVPQINSVLTNLQKYLNDNEKNIRKELLSIRKIEKFKIAYIYMIRHKIVHEGFNNNDILIKFNNDLEKIFYRTIVAYTCADNTHNLKKVISNINKPF